MNYSTSLETMAIKYHRTVN